MSTLKMCPRCGKEKPLTADFFVRSSAHRNGYRCECKECTNKWRREYRKRYKGYLITNRRTYKKYAQTQRGKYVIKANGINGRARRLDLPGRITGDDVQRLLEMYDHCLCCGKKDDLHIDHVIPLSDGGRNIFENLQVLCVSCNARKGFSYIVDYRNSDQELTIVTKDEVLAMIEKNTDDNFVSEILERAIDNASHFSDIGLYLTSIINDLTKARAAIYSISPEKQIILS